MAFKNLQTDEMLQVSGTWTNPQSDAHIALVAVPDLGSKIARLKDAHDTLSDASQPSENPRMNAISVTEHGLDVRHDSVIRGTFGFLTSLAELLGGQAGNDLIVLRDQLIPEGLVSTQKTYRAEAGQAQQLENRFTATLKAQTDALTVGSGQNAKTLTAYLEEWVALGKDLGKLEDEKGKLLAEQSGQGAGTALVKARNHWIRVVNAMVADAELAELPPDVEALVFGPLRDAEKKADQRVRAAAAPKQEPQEPGKTGGGT